MRVALCLSGQPRSYRKGFEYHKQNLLSRPGMTVDVYMHTWESVPIETRKDMVRLYQDHGRHKVVLHCNNIPEEILKTVDAKYTRIPSPEFPARNTYMMWHSIWQSIVAIPGEDLADYDVVVRSRYDFALNTPINIAETRVNTVYVPNDRMTHGHTFCADMFAWGTPIVMVKYATTFMRSDEYYKNGTIYIGEDLLAAQLRHEGLIGENMQYVHMNNPFPPGPYNGNWHSFIRDDFKEWNQLRD